MIGSDSMFVACTVVSVLDVSGNLEQPKWVDLAPRPLDVDYPDNHYKAVEGTDTWGTLGLTYLGLARGWWGIGLASRIIDPFTELTVGKTLVVPSPDTLFFNLLNRKEE